jgi:phosphomevalonate kinase
MANRETHISAPGKVLLTGGYLVLDQRFQGLVIAIDSRFHVVVKEVPCATAVIDRQNIQISVRSPQFIDGEWEYKFDTVNGILHQLDPQGKCNKFVASALYFSLGFIQKSKGFIGWGGDKYLDIQILGDNDFYSQLEYVSALAIYSK